MENFSFERGLFYHKNKCNKLLYEKEEKEKLIESLKIQQNKLKNLLRKQDEYGTATGMSYDPNTTPPQLKEIWGEIFRITPQKYHYQLQKEDLWNMRTQPGFFQLWQDRFRLLTDLIDKLTFSINHSSQ